MKKIGLILLACLTLTLQSVAQAPEKVAPDDLVVTVEIIDHEYFPNKNQKNKPILVLSAKMTIRNTTNYQRKIVVMTCSWNWDWTAKGGHFICGPSGCDSNFPDSVIIPAGQTVEFYDRLCGVKSDSVRSFQLGFIDIPEEKEHTNLFFGEKLSHEPVVYWSNVVKDDVRLIATEEIKEKVRIRQHGLVGEEK